MVKTRIKQIEEMIQQMPNSQLKKVKEIVNKEIKLSEACIKAGEEKRS